MLAVDGKLAYSPAPVAGSQSQLEVKLVPAIKLAVIFFSNAFLMMLGDKTATSLPNGNTSAFSEVTH